MKPFVKRQKNDAVDAAAIAEAALRPNMHCVAVKSAEHQARAVAFRTHQCFVRQRTQLINSLGAMRRIRWIVRKGVLPDNWLGRILGRKPRMVVAVALANKMARIIWAMMMREQNYRIA